MSIRKRAPRTRPTESVLLEESELLPPATTGSTSIGITAAQQGINGLKLEAEELATDVEAALVRLEETITHWEQVGYELLDRSAAPAYEFLTSLRRDVLSGSRAKAEALVNFMDKQVGAINFGHSFAEKVKEGVNYFDGLLHQAQSVQTAVLRAKHKLLTLEELPSAWIDNPYITRGYRFCAGPWECVQSVVHIHNETCNIWTHILGAVMMIGIGMWHMPKTDMWRNGTWMDRVPMIVFILAAIKCLACSVVWHTFSNIAHLSIKQRMACVDYIGITILITASILSTEYSVLYCNPLARNFYMAVTAVSGAAGVVISSNPKFDTREARPLRAAFFVCFALGGVFGGIHAAVVRGWAETVPFYLPVIKSLLAYGTGVLFYALLIPERWAPKSVLNFIGASHNIWHLFVLIGIYYHYQAMVDIFDRAQLAGCAV